MRLFATRLTAIAATLRRAWSPTSLFASGEQGVWYDPSDMSTMYQDAAGTTPCYQPGQGQVDPPVGLLLDKRLGLVRGPELVSNGNFASGSTGWSVSGTDATHIITFSPGSLLYQSDTSTPSLTFQQGVGMSIGKWYELTIVVSGWISGDLKTSSLAAANTVIPSGAGTKKIIGQALGTSLVLLRNSTNVDLTIASISIRELPGNHAYQSTTTCRPTLSARYNKFLSTESLSDAAWLKSGGGLGLTPTVSDNYGAAPDGTNTAARVSLTLGGGTSSADLALLYQATSIPNSRQVWWLKTADGSTKTVYIRGGTASTFVVTGDWAQYSIATGTTAGTQTGIGLRGGQVPACSNTADLLVWHPNVATANDGVGLPPYQRVVDPNNYDTVGFPPYLRFDGVDDSLQTASVDFSGTGKIFVSLALRKLSDAARGIVVELGPAAESTLGGFSVEAPSAGLQNVAVRASGTTSPNTVQTTAALAPLSVCLSAKLDSGYGVSLRLNGGGWAENKVAFGGAFSNASLSIGRRSGTSIPFSGRLYSLLVRGAITPDAQIATVERYLNSKARIY